MQVTIDKQDGRALVKLAGRFDLTGNLTFRNATRPLLSDANVKTIVIDFQQVSYLDSTALGLLLLLREQAVANDKELILTHCGPELTRVFSISQFHRLFRIE